MKTIYTIIILSSLFIANSPTYSTTSVVVLSGGIIKAKQLIDNPIKKYTRKKCPICKGTGKYRSGDGIKEVDCGYCEPETEATMVKHKL